MLKNESINDNNLFSKNSERFNFQEKSTLELEDLIKSLNIINPDSLSQDDLSLIQKRVDDYSGLFTTQQLENIDYSSFKNHVFFDSAVNKVVTTFDRIQRIPYDSDELKNVRYFSKNDGYTKHIIKNIFPKSKGYIKFLGSQALVIFDEQGKVINDVSEDKKVGLLNPLNNRFSFDFWLNATNSVSNNNKNNQIIFKKIQYSNNTIKNGFICYLSYDNSSSKYFLNLKVFIEEKESHSRIEYNSSYINNWQHIAINVKKDKNLEFIINGKLFINSSNPIKNEIQNKSFPQEFKGKNIPFVLGGAFYINQNSISNTLSGFNNFEGSIDEFRYFYKFRSTATIRKEMHKNIYAQKGLNLYLRLNEPGGSYTNSCLSIDFSGNKLHGLLYNITGTLSIINDTTNYKINTNTPLNLEKIEDSPVLISSFTKTKTIRQNLIDLAKEYDRKNSNLIFNLLPRHYFLTASEFQNLPVFSNNDVYSTGDQITANNLEIKPSQIEATIPANHELVNIVLIWAKFFDKLKIYVSSITDMLNIDYDSVNTKSITGMQLPILCKTYGFNFKEILSTNTKNKLNNENLNFEDIISEMSIRKIQNLLWQRFLINTQSFLRSKGTIKSVESTFNSFGIDYSKFINVREYSSNNIVTQKKNFNFQPQNIYSLNFSNTNNLLTTPSFSLNEGFSDNNLFFEILDIKSKVLNQNLNTDSVEKGLGKNDWSIELFFKFNDAINNTKFLNQSILIRKDNPSYSYDDTQYLFVMDTGTNNNDDGAVIIVKYQRENGFNTKVGNITVEIQPIAGSNFNQTLTLSNVNIFDLEKHLVLTQKRLGNKLKYTLNLSDVGDQIEIKSKKNDTTEIDITDLENKINNNEYNFYSTNKNLNFKIGSYKYNTNNNLNSLIVKNSIFQGKVLKVRFWKHCLTDKEILSHTKDIKSIGKENFKPLETLILDTESKNLQNSDRVLNNNVYEWSIEDISNNAVLNNNTLANINTCKLKTKNQKQTSNLVITQETMFCKDFSPKIDEAFKKNRINVISYEKSENKEATNNNNVFPSNEMPIYFDYDQVNRVSIDMSIVKVINDDISKIISDLNDFTLKVNNNLSIYEYQYKDLNTLREDYFSKFSDSNYVNYASIGNVFKYFDNIMSSILFDIVPSRVRFDGFNFVYESHALERHKYQYKNKDSINTIINHYDRFEYSRDCILSRRNFEYNKNRSQMG